MKRSTRKILGTLLFAGLLFAISGCNQPETEPYVPEQEDPYKKEVDTAINHNGEKFEIDKIELSVASVGTLDNYIFATTYSLSDFHILARDMSGFDSADISSLCEVFVDGVKLTGSITIEHKKEYTISAKYQGKYNLFTTSEKKVIGVVEGDLICDNSSRTYKAVEGFCSTGGSVGSISEIIKEDGSYTTRTYYLSTPADRQNFSFWIGSDFDSLTKIDGDIQNHKFISSDKVVYIAKIEETTLQKSKLYAQVPVVLTPVSDINILIPVGERPLPKVGQEVTLKTWTETNGYFNLGIVVDGKLKNQAGRGFYSGKGSSVDELIIEIYDNEELDGTPIVTLTSSEGSWTPSKTGKFYFRPIIKTGEKTIELTKEFTKSYGVSTHILTVIEE